MITLEAINQINQQYLQRMNEIEAMKVQESRSAKFARQAGALLSTDESPAIATIVRCDDCGGTGYQKQDCECYPFNPNGCALCDYKGWTKIPCPTCKEQGEVLMYKNGKVEALI